ncbi:hypothetical protein [Micrococcoides hystricis]|uniref:Uncharacterized protein n=1 Tax=Micrococcoides hystricis TaxID=1572761 RepID=A0ABV6PE32_9MICC
MLNKWNREHAPAAAARPDLWTCLEANIYGAELDQIALAADEWTGFMQPLREDLADYPFNGYLSNDIYIEMGHNTDLSGTKMFTVLFFATGQDPVKKLAMGADALTDHLQLAGVPVEKIRWETPELRG